VFTDKKISTLYIKYEKKHASYFINKYIYKEIKFFFTDIYAHMYYIFSKTWTEKGGEERDEFDKIKNQDHLPKEVLPLGKISTESTSRHEFY